jgi:hypothetical protein
MRQWFALFENDGTGDIVRRVMDEYGFSPKYINNGWCWGFAVQLAKALGPEAKVIDTTSLAGVFPGHSVVEFRGRYYDAESPDGVVDPKDLAYSKRLRATKDRPRYPRDWPRAVSAAELVRIVKRIHRAPEDFSEGDLENRIYRFTDYTLEWLPIAVLDLNEWDIDDEMVADYAGRSDQYPPIVFDGADESIIDGAHRANAADHQGAQYVLAYYGHPADQDPNWDPQED